MQRRSARGRPRRGVYQRSGNTVKRVQLLWRSTSGRYRSTRKPEKAERKRARAPADPSSPAPVLTIGPLVFRLRLFRPMPSPPFRYSLRLHAHPIAHLARILGAPAFQVGGHARDPFGVALRLG